MLKTQFKSRQIKNFACILTTVPPIERNKLQYSNNRMDIAVKLISKLKNKRLYPYNGNPTFNRRKITSNVLKIERIMP